MRYSIDNPHAYAQSNLVGHLNLLELARQRSTAHMVYASSSSVYGGNTKLPFAVEDRADHPVSLYAATKHADELMSESYAHLYRLPLTGLRFFTVYGPWGRPDMMMWKFTEAILAGRPIPVFNHGEMHRDFTYIDDIVAGVIACLDAPPADDGEQKAGGSAKPHALYNIGNSKPEHLMKVIGLLEEACGREGADRNAADAAGRRAANLCRHRRDSARSWLCADHRHRGRRASIRGVVSRLSRSLGLGTREPGMVPQRRFACRAFGNLRREPSIGDAGYIGGKLRGSVETQPLAMKRERKLFEHCDFLRRALFEAHVVKHAVDPAGNPWRHERTAAQVRQHLVDLELGRQAIVHWHMSPFHGQHAPTWLTES